MQSWSHRTPNVYPPQSERELAGRYGDPAAGYALGPAGYERFRRDFSLSGRAVPAGRLTPALADRLLARDWFLLIERTPAGAGHARLVYGRAGDRLRVMDPAAGTEMRDCPMSGLGEVFVLEPD
jgi:hypothetical protein